MAVISTSSINNFGPYGRLFNQKIFNDLEQGLVALALEAPEQLDLFMKAQLTKARQQVDMQIDSAVASGRVNGEVAAQAKKVIDLAEREKSVDYRTIRNKLEGIGLDAESIPFRPYLSAIMRWNGEKDFMKTIATVAHVGVTTADPLGALVQRAEAYDALGKETNVFLLQGIKARAWETWKKQMANKPQPSPFAVRAGGSDDDEAASAATPTLPKGQLGGYIEEETLSSPVPFSLRKEAS